MSSAEASTLLSNRNHVSFNSISAFPRMQLSYSADSPGLRKIVELYVASSGDTESGTLRIYQGKEVVNSSGSPVGAIISPLCSVAWNCGSDPSGVLGTAAGVEDLFTAHTYTVTTSTTSTTPKGIGATIGATYGGGIVAYSPTDGSDARVIITDTGNADFLLFDLYSDSAVTRYIFAEAGV
jgi:hypothetical protein